MIYQIFRSVAKKEQTMKKYTQAGNHVFGTSSNFKQRDRKYKVQTLLTEEQEMLYSTRHELDYEDAEREVKERYEERVRKNRDE